MWRPLSSLARAHPSRVPVRRASAAHGSAFLAPEHAPSRPYADEDALRADLARLVALQVPLATLKAVGETLQPRARAKWELYLSQATHLAGRMETCALPPLPSPPPGPAPS